jgi:hypothetical protein
VVVPEPVERVSQATFSLVAHDNVPPLGFLRVINCAAGAAPPAIPEKLRVLGLSEMLGAALVSPTTVRDTGIVVWLIRPLNPCIAMTTLVA